MYLLLTVLATSVIVCVVSCGSVSIDINIHTITTELLLLPDCRKIYEKIYEIVYRTN